MEQINRISSKQAQTVSNQETGQTQIRIYGVGKLCKRSRILELNVRRALKELGIKAKLEVIVDFKKIAETEIRYLPALTVNGKIVLQGGVQTVGRLKRHFKALLG